MVDAGRVVAAASQERFDRVKKSPAFPFQAIDYCLAAGGISFDQLDAVCFNFDFGQHKRLYEGHDLAHSYWRQCLSPEAVREQLAKRYRLTNTLTVEHVQHHGLARDDRQRLARQAGGRHAGRDHDEGVHAAARGRSGRVCMACGAH